MSLRGSLQPLITNVGRCQTKLSVGALTKTKQQPQCGVNKNGTLMSSPPFKIPSSPTPILLQSCRNFHQSPTKQVKLSQKKKNRKDDEKMSRRSASNFDTLGSWNNRLEMPVNMELSIKAGKLIPKISAQYTGADSAQGRRRENEDRYTVKDLTNNILMIAIFDGHGGPMAADYTSTHIENHIKFWLERGETDLSEILQKSFLNVHNSYTKYLYHHYGPNDMPITSGTTATVCLLRNSVELVVAHVGDSCALVCRGGQVIRLTKDHDPELESEQERIHAAGGRIVSTSHGRARVQGRLNMTRSIGDLDLKPYGVSAEPEIQTMQIKHHKDAFLALTTDGVNSALTDKEICDFASTCRTTKEAAKFLTDQSMHYGSDDNVTTVIIPFGSWGKYAGMANSQQQIFGRSTFGLRYG